MSSEHDFSVFEDEGVEFLADQRSVLTSNPPKYNCYRLSDRKLFYKFCSMVKEKHKRYATRSEAKFLIPEGSSFNL